LSRILDQRSVGPNVRAEALALRGSNKKTQWVGEWRGAERPARPGIALASQLLYDSVRDYEDGFSEDQNHYYSGINALSLTTLITQLAKAEPDTWSSRFRTETAAAAELQQTEKRRQALSATVQQSLDAAEHRQRLDGLEDPWLDMTWADYRLLT